MEVNIEKQYRIKINNVVNKWDISEELKSEKINILTSWYVQIGDNKKFDIILKICNEFQYYSEKKTASIYEILLEDRRKELTDFDVVLKSTLFTPLRSKDRIESSVDMFSNFRLANKIDANSTFVEGPIIFIKKFKQSINSSREVCKRITLDINLLNDEKLYLKSELTHTTEIGKRKDISKAIKVIKEKINKKNSSIIKEIEEFKKNYYYVKDIVIIDDFIGTGTSGENLIKDLAKELDGTDIDISFHLWVLETSMDGKKKIEELADSLGIKLEIKSNEISKNVLEENKVFSSNEILMAKETVDSITKEFNIPLSSFSKNHALASFVNAPNNNLELLSNESDQWKALFLRIKRGNKDKVTLNSNELKDIMKFVMKG